MVKLCLVACAIFLSATSVFALQPSAEHTGLSLSGLKPAPQVTVYLVAGEEHASARLTVRRVGRTEGDRLMVRAFDANEAPSYWQHLEPGQLKTVFNPGNDEVWGIPLNIPVNPKNGDLFLETDVPIRGVGVHQIRLTAGSKNSIAHLKVNQDLPYGISFQNGTFSAWEASRKRCIFTCLLTQKNFESQGPVRVFNETGTEVFNAAENRMSKETRAEVKKTSVVWRVEFPKLKDLQMRAGGFPVIRCPTESAANAIQASVEQLADGTVVAWKFQRQIAELLPKLLAQDKVGRADELIVPLASRKNEWMKDPARNVQLAKAFGLFADVEETLKGKNVEPESHWGGALSGWQDRIGKSAPENRWDRLTTVKGFGREPLHAMVQGQRTSLKLPFWMHRSIPISVKKSS